jgi:hypothetical protein
MEVVMADEPNPGDTTTPPVDPAASAAVADPPAPTGSEPDTNSGTEPEMVPSGRLREETEKRRRAEEDNTRLQAELEASKTPTPPTTDDDYPDETTEKLLDAYVKKHGFVSQEELAKQRNQIQVQQDVKDLETTPPNPGIAYDHREVMDYAKTNNMPVTSKAALRAAYRELNYDKIVETERQKAIDTYKKTGQSGAELPGSSGAAPPSEPKLSPNLSPKERTRERIRLARQNLTI